MYLYVELGKKFGLRWFTPTSEVPLCGHATLASSAAMFNEIGMDKRKLRKVSCHKSIEICIDKIRIFFIACSGNKHDVIEFQTLHSGSLFVRKAGEEIAIELPLNKTTKQV